MLNFSVTYFITIVNLAVLFFVLRKFLFKRVTDFMNARTAKIEGDLAEAERRKDEAKAIERELDRKSASAEAAAAEIMAAARVNAVKAANQIVAESREKAAALLEDAKAEIAAEREAALLVFKNEAAALVVQAASRLIETELNSGGSATRQANITLAGKLLKELGADKARSSL
jgi:F-type H+-transporting ATPase subunit b